MILYNSFKLCQLVVEYKKIIFTKKDDFQYLLCLNNCKNCLFIFERKSCKNGFTKNILLRKWLNVLLQVKILCNVKAKKSLLLTFLVSKSLATGFALQNYCVCMSGSLFDDKFSHLKAFFRMVQNTTTRACYSKFELNMK